MFSINNVLNRRSFLVGATLIFAPIYYTPASVLLKNAKDMSYDMTLMGVDGMDSLCDPGRQVHRRLSAYNDTGGAVLFRARTPVTERKHYFHTIKWLNCINRQEYAELWINGQNKGKVEIIATFLN